MKCDVFYHMFCMNDFMQRFENTFNKIQNSNLYDEIEHIYINVAGNNQDIVEQATSILKDPKFVVTNSSIDLTGEIDTLKYLHDVCSKVEENKPVLYLHSKGVSRVGNNNVQAWIDYMEYFVIEKWDACIQSLDTHDTCGVNLQYIPGKHYSGNFWWANTDYLKQLPKININDCNVSYCTNNPRAYCEFWLLDNNFCNPCSLHNSGKDHYATFYDKTNYQL